MTPILILKAFGHLPSVGLIEAERQREKRELTEPPKSSVKVGILHHAFEARAEFMGWAATSSKAAAPQPLWNMFEAGLVDSDEDPSLIGWVYVGLANPIDLLRALPEIRTTPKVTLQEGRELPENLPEGARGGWATIQMPPGYDESTVAIPVALPPFVQCLDDALRRIGATEVSGYQLTCHRANLQPGQGNRGHLIYGISWFNVPAPDALAVDALVAFDRGFLGGHSASELVSRIGRRGNEPFEFSLAPDMPELRRIKTSGSAPSPHITFDPSKIGLSVRLPEWSASAAGWALATVIDAAHAIAPDVENFIVRITRVQ